VEVAKKIEAEEKDAEGTNESTEEASSSNINEGKKTVCRFCKTC
jgi:hypothetical protein